MSSKGFVGAFVGFIQATLKFVLTISMLRGINRAEDAQQQLEELLDRDPPVSPFSISAEQLEQISEGDLAPLRRIEPRRAILQAGEECLMEIQGCLLLDRIRTPGSFRSLGVSSGGISLRTGSVQLAGSGSLRRSLGKGDLVVTTSRLLFVGGQHSLDILLSKIIGITAFRSGFEINVSGSIKVFAFFTAVDGTLPAAVVRGAVENLNGLMRGIGASPVDRGAGSSITFSYGPARDE